MCWTVADTDSDQARFFDDVSWDIFNLYHLSRRVSVCCIKKDVIAKPEFKHPSL